MQPAAGGRSGIGVILLSYNRPKMLELALSSVRDARPDEIILVDDGSDVFDPAEWAERNGIKLRVLAARRSLDQRMTQPSLGRLINGALHIAAKVRRLAAVAYLCDDDLFTPIWLDAVREELAFPNGPHVVRGRWRSFDDPLDGDPIARPKRSRPTPLDVRRMTTGNFAHRTECYEEGLRWAEDTVAVHDDTFLWRLHRIHPFQEAVDAGVLAGYRREHRFNMAGYTSHQHYAVGAEEVLRRGALE